MGDSSDGYIQLLNMIVEDKRTRNVFLKSFGVGRCEIPVPASNFDDQLPGWLINAVEKEYTYHFALSLARYRARSPIVLQALKMQEKTEDMLMNKVASFLRRVSLDSSCCHDIEKRRLLCDAALLTALQSPRRPVDGD